MICFRVWLQRLGKNVCLLIRGQTLSHSRAVTAELKLCATQNRRFCANFSAISKALSNQRRYSRSFRCFFTVCGILLNYCTQHASKELRANAGNQVK